MWNYGHKQHGTTEHPLDDLRQEVDRLRGIVQTHQVVIDVILKSLEGADHGTREKILKRLESSGVPGGADRGVSVLP